MRAIIRMTMRQLVLQPVRAGALGGAIVLPLFQIVTDSDPHLSIPFWPMMVAVIATAGVIGLEVSNGSLALFLVRPLNRATYVVARGAGALAVAVAAMTVGLAGEIAIVLYRGGELHAQSIAVTFVERFIVVVGVTSILTSLSSLLSSLGDLLAWTSLIIVAMSLKTAGSAVSMPSLIKTGDALRLIAIPSIDVDRVFTSMSWPWSDITVYAAIVTLALALGISAINLRQVSYGSE